MPIDLVLDVEKDDGSFNVTLSNVLRDRAIRDTIQRVHLKSRDPFLLSSIISSLTANPKEPRSTSMESLILQVEGGRLVNVSDFLAHYNFPKLRRLELFNCKVSSWNLIPSLTPALTTLDLNFKGFWSSDNPTTSQLLLILASYPTLQKVSLSWLDDLDDGGGDSDDGSGDPSPQVQLHHLRELKLHGSSPDVFELLGRLDHPRHMDHLVINLENCAVEDILQTIGPYLRDYLSNRGRSQNGLGLSLTLSSSDIIKLQISDAGGVDFSAPVPATVNTFMTFTIELYLDHAQDQVDQVILDLIAHAPREEVVYFRVYDEPVAMEDISTQFPNLRGLHFEKTPLTAAFPKSNFDGDGGVFPSLEYVLLDWVYVDDGDWSSLTTSLDRRASSGNPLHTLVMIGTYYVAPSVLRSLKDVVREFKHGIFVGSTLRD